MKYLLAILMTCPFASVTAQNLYFPPANNSQWDTLSPTSLQWCQDNINELYTYLDGQQTKSFIVLKDGKLVIEKYFGTYTRDSIWPWFSAGKSLRALLIGIAQEEGKLDILNKTSTYLGPGWTSLPRDKEDLITVRHQLSMTSGLNEIAFTCITPNCLVYVADAGTRWIYHNGPYNLLKNVLEEATGQSINVYTALKVKFKTGMATGIWLPSGNNTYYFSSARDMARFGLLIINKGKWGAIPVLSDSIYYNQMTHASQFLNPSYGYLWWLNGQGTFIPPSGPFTLTSSIAPEAPEDVILAAGAQGQFISVSPATGMVMIRQGLSNSEDNAELELHNEIWMRLMSLNCMTTSQKEISPGQIKLYPNPAKKTFQVKGVDATNTSITLIDMNGKRLKFLRNQLAVDIDGLPKGVYLVLITTSTSKRIEKLLIL